MHGLTRVFFSVEAYNFIIGLSDIGIGNDKDNARLKHWLKDKIISISILATPHQPIQDRKIRRGTLAGKALTLRIGTSVSAVTTLQFSPHHSSSHNCLNFVMYA